LRMFAPPQHVDRDDAVDALGVEQPHEIVCGLLPAGGEKVPEGRMRGGANVRGIGAAPHSVSLPTFPCACRQQPTCGRGERTRTTIAAFTPTHLRQC
jgi:hypothetical protein